MRLRGQYLRQTGSAVHRAGTGRWQRTQRSGSSAHRGLRLANRNRSV